MNQVPGKITAALPESPALAAAFAQIARGGPVILAQDLITLEANAEIDGTLARAHCYAIGTDGNGWLRTDLLIEAICAAVLEYAIPRSKVQEATELCTKHNYKGPLVALAAEARALFTHLSQTGEGGELLLFCISEFLLGYPQVLAKMHLKTAADVHYHGADGVHASVDPKDGKLCLWWGESKLHRTFAGAVRECIKSLAPFLIEPASSKAKRDRDLNLLRYNTDLDDELLENAIKDYLNIKSPNYRHLKFGGLALVGFDDATYPAHPKKADPAIIAERVLESVVGWKKAVGKHISARQLSEIDLHVFLVPFPSVADFRKKILKAVGAR